MASAAFSPQPPRSGPAGLEVLLGLALGSLTWASCASITLSPVPGSPFQLFPQCSFQLLQMCRGGFSAVPGGASPAVQGWLFQLCSRGVLHLCRESSSWPQKHRGRALQFRTAPDHSPVDRNRAAAPSQGLLVGSNEGGCWGCGAWDMAVSSGPWHLNDRQPRISFIKRH